MSYIDLTIQENHHPQKSWSETSIAYNSIISFNYKDTVRYRTVQVQYITVGLSVRKVDCNKVRNGGVRNGKTQPLQYKYILSTKMLGKHNLSNVPQHFPGTNELSNFICTRKMFG